MKKLVIVTFVFFYTSFTVLLVVRRTASWASNFAEAAKSQTAQMRPQSPRLVQARIIEDSLLVAPVHAASPLALLQSTPHPPSAERAPKSGNPAVAPRAPPALL